LVQKQLTFDMWSTSRLKQPVINGNRYITVIKWKRLRWMRHVESMGNMRNAYKIWFENRKERSYSEDIGVDGMTILERVLVK